VKGKRREDVGKVRWKIC